MHGVGAMLCMDSLRWGTGNSYMGGGGYCGGRYPDSMQVEIDIARGRKGGRGSWSVPPRLKYRSCFFSPNIRCKGLSRIILVSTLWTRLIYPYRFTLNSTW